LGFRRESEAARFHADELLVVEDGRIADFGSRDEVAARHAGLEVTTISDRLVVPGFIAAGRSPFCPCSNLFLGSGLFRLGRATDPEHRVRLSFGTDVGGGNRFSMLSVLDEAYKIGMMNNGMLKDAAEAERNKLSSYRGFWSITLGGAEGLYIDDLVGNFDPGKEADFVVLDCNGGPPAPTWRQSLIADGGKLPTIEQAADLLFGLMVVGDDRAIAQTWAMGTQVYQRR
jgi:guanine deaminase